MIRGYLDAMHVGRCDLMAASMGGWIALKFAADHPERVRRLVLVDSAGFPYATTMTESTWTPSNAAEMRALIALQTDRVTWIPGFVMRDLLRQNRDHAWILRRAFRSMMTGRDLMKGRVQRVTMPVLLIWGMRDRIVPLAIGEEMRRELPNAKFVAFSGCGHLAVVECRDRVLPAVEKFLAGVTPSDPERSEGESRGPLTQMRCRSLDSLRALSNDMPLIRASRTFSRREKDLDETVSLSSRPRRDPSLSGRGWPKAG
jgi:pimeloyl-ACP methyl ester carboxylesterase